MALGVCSFAQEYDKKAGEEKLNRFFNQNLTNLINQLDLCFGKTMRSDEVSECTRDSADLRTESMVRIVTSCSGSVGFPKVAGYTNSMVKIPSSRTNVPRCSLRD